MWDKPHLRGTRRGLWNDGAALEDLLDGDVKKHKRGTVALLTGQGIPMLQSGQEFRRTKKGNHNSYDQDTDVNWLDWSRKQTHRDMFELCADMLSIRQHFKALRQSECLSGSSIQWLQPANERGLGYLLKASGDYKVPPPTGVSLRAPGKQATTARHA